MRKVLILGALASAVAFGLWRVLFAPSPISAEALAERYATPLSPPAEAFRVYHLGHSLVNRDMPVMLEQMARAAGFTEHAHNSQLGWGASLDRHRRRDLKGFDVENSTKAYRPAEEAMASGEYGAVVLTEMVEIKDAVRYHDSARALAHWVKAARSGNPAARIYLYETWHRLDDPDGWLERIDRDLALHWEGDLLRPAMADPEIGTIHVIPAGQVLAAAVRAVEAGQVPGMASREEFFALKPDGSLDQIHLNDLGNWLVASVHFSVLYQRSPEGLPHRLVRADGTPANPVPDTAVSVLQKLVWDTVRRYPSTGLPTPASGTP